MKTVVTISRQWKNPKIVTKVSNKGIKLSMNMTDFAEALKEEIGPVTWIVKKATFDANLDRAIKAIIDKVKQETTKVI